MLKSNTLLNQYLKESLFKGVSPMSRKSFIKNLRVIGPWGLNVVIVPTKHTVGKTSSSRGSYQAKAETQSGSGTHTSQTTGVIMTIQYRTPDGAASAKIFKTTEAEAYDFITELKEGVPFPTLYCEGQVCAFSAKHINEVRAEKTDVGEVSESKGS